MTASILLMVWLIFPMIFSFFIPLSFITFIYFFIFSNREIRKVNISMPIMSILFLLLFYLLLQSFFNQIFLKDFLRYADITIVTLTAKKFIYDLLNVPISQLFLFVALPYLLAIQFSKLNTNYPSVAILIAAVIVIYKANTQSKKISFINPILFTSSIFASVYTISVGFISYWLRLHPLKFIVIFFTNIYLLYYFLENASFLKLYFSSALSRLDIWIYTLSYWIRSSDPLIILFGYADPDFAYTNGDYTLFSNFTFVGKEPHNLFIYMCHQYGLTGLLLFLSLLKFGINTNLKKILFIPLFVLFWFEATNNFMYLGILAIILNLPKDQCLTYEKLQKKNSF